ncbi:MAG TPA: GYD domain-containing protein [Silvibacterium sp.]|nr:GYD domain-containing protein [Silvibacterium sp.]
MATFVTQARFTKDGLNAMIAAPQDRAEAVGRLIAQVGGKLITCYLTSGDYDILLIFEAPSYEDTVPALIVAAAESGIADLKTVTALTSSEMKSASVKAGPIAASYRSAAGRRPAAPSSAETQTHLSNSDFQREGGGTAQEAQDDVKAATAVLDAEKRAVDDIREGRSAPYYFAPRETQSQRASSPRSTKSAGTKPKK